MIADVEATLAEGMLLTNLDVVQSLVNEIYILGEEGGRFGLGLEVDALLARFEALPRMGCRPHFLRRAAAGARAFEASSRWRRRQGEGAEASPDLSRELVPGAQTQ